mmetsp:Transcript_34267/g.55198  ORF Transcript_34267/g.55198 Transcript_34267/m.55198 type:complete len:171 (-) Transcript_34267:159-671(-)
MWQDMASEEKKSYYERAQAERERVEKERKQFLDAGGVITRKRKGPDLLLSTNKIRKVMDLDPENRSCSREGLSLMSKSTEAFIGLLSKRAEKLALAENRKTIRAGDFFLAIRTSPDLEFLQDPLLPHTDFPPLNLGNENMVSGEEKKGDQKDVSAPLPPPPVSTSDSNLE